MEAGEMTLPRTHRNVRRIRVTSVLLTTGLLAMGALSGCATPGGSSATTSSPVATERQAGEKSTRLCIKNDSTTEVTATFNRFDGINGDPNADYVVGLTAQGGTVCADGWYSSPPDVSADLIYMTGDGKFVTWQVSAENRAFDPPNGRIMDDGKNGVCRVFAVGDNLYLADGNKSFTIKRNSDSGFKEFQVTIADSADVSQKYDCTDSYYPG
jgi:hypothetical protein